MNKARREEIRDIIESLESLKEDLDMVASDERGSFENLPEGLQYSERGEQMEENADTLEDLASNLEDVISGLEDVIG